MSKIFFTADTHFGHEAILQFCERPWKNTTRMDKALIRNWNETVSENDIVYILGDYVWAGPSEVNEVKKITKKLNGIKVLICGNHDYLSPSQYTECGIHQVIYPYLTIMDFHLIHDPALATACPKNSHILSGHVHQLYGKSSKGPMEKIIIDVGIDGWDYRPVEYYQILEEINKYYGSKDK